jgi:hypothetical protein
MILTVTCVGIWLKFLEAADVLETFLGICQRGVEMHGCLVVPDLDPFVALTKERQVKWQPIQVTMLGVVA